MSEGRSSQGNLSLMSGVAPKLKEKHDGKRTLGHVINEVASKSRDVQVGEFFFYLFDITPRWGPSRLTTLSGSFNSENTKIGEIINAQEIRENKNSGRKIIFFSQLNQDL